MKKGIFLLLILFSLLLINFVSAGLLQVTQEHPFYVKNSWIPANQLQIGDLLTTIDGKKARIISIEQVNEPVEVYNLEDSIFHNYIADGIIVHNSNTPIKSFLEACKCELKYLGDETGAFYVTPPKLTPLERMQLNLDVATILRNLPSESRGIAFPGKGKISNLEALKSWLAYSYSSEYNYDVFVVNMQHPYFSEMIPLRQVASGSGTRLRSHAETVKPIRYALLRLTYGTALQEPYVLGGAYIDNPALLEPGKPPLLVLGGTTAEVHYRPFAADQIETYKLFLDKIVKATNGKLNPGIADMTETSGKIVKVLTLPNGEKVEIDLALSDTSLMRSRHGKNNGMCPELSWLELGQDPDKNFDWSKVKDQ